MIRNITCIICPRGCAMTAEQTGDQVTVTGFACPRGQEYAVNECLHPVRTVTSTVRVSNRKDCMVSVKTATPVPKDAMAQVMAQLRATSVEAPVKLGQVILYNVFGSAIVATKAVE